MLRKIIQIFSYATIIQSTIKGQTKLLAHLSTRDVFPTPGAPISITFADRIDENWCLSCVGSIIDNGWVAINQQYLHIFAGVLEGFASRFHQRIEVSPISPFTKVHWRCLHFVPGRNCIYVWGDEYSRTPTEH